MTALPGLVALALSALLQVPTVDIPPVGEPGGPIQPLTPAQLFMFARGQELFDQDFHAADGLGTPDFNANSCRACHQDPVMGGAGPLELNVSRFGRDGFGLQTFQDLPGGQAASKLRPPGHVKREDYPPEADVFEQRQTPALFGLGLVAFIPDAEIFAHEDPTDADGDGIRGIARRVMVNGQMEVGRFGWKAQLPRMADFVRDAMLNEVGVTTADDGRGFTSPTDGDAVADPELDHAREKALEFFLLALGPPLRDGGTDPAIARGEQVFSDIACDRCHVPTMQSTFGPAHLYSDLLLHDVMGPGFRGMAEDGAPVGMYRTPPLWGIEDTAPYLHDGRAEDLVQAILLHDGEASLSRQGFVGLPVSSQADLVAFLEDL